ncbi:hypothetical protein [Rhizobium halophilum]|uniref:hypothetical protein n=1 Tax=Rhizobium halophilum TaxID=2846852 RepID=UPI001EFD91B7|nr:hypothetical protein [Rhizobium halophilum]MCF6371260.1 hypothetical protein [Rhizobium halophilum]
MNEILAKLSSYDIFVNLVPGALFFFFLSVSGIYTLGPNTVIGELVVYYFIGLVISRIGSVVIEPILKGCRIIKYGAYSDFVRASDKDPKIQILLEASNLFRTLLALVLVCAIAYNWNAIRAAAGLSDWAWVMICCALLVLLFLISFRKQNGFISKRVSHHSEPKDT